jgi:hypothetical protein
VFDCVGGTPGTAKWIFVRVIGLSNPPQAAANTAYLLGAQVLNSGGIYICVGAGTSQNSGWTGPLGTSQGQTDGTVTWNYISPAFPTASYSTAQRPGSLLLQGATSRVMQQVISPGTFFVWTKLGASIQPGDTPESSTNSGARICMVDSGYEHSRALLEVSVTTAGNSGIAPVGISIVFALTGPSADSKANRDAVTYVYAVMPASTGNITDSSATSVGTPTWGPWQSMMNRNIVYAGMLVQGNGGSSPTIVTAFLAGADRSWFKPPPLYSQVNWGSGGLGYTATGWMSGAQFNFVQLQSNDTALGSTSVTYSQQAQTYTCFEFVRAGLNNSVPP